MGCEFRSIQMPDGTLVNSFTCHVHEDWGLNYAEIEYQIFAAEMRERERRRWYYEALDRIQGFRAERWPELRKLRASSRPINLGRASRVPSTAKHW